MKKIILDIEARNFNVTKHRQLLHDIEIYRTPDHITNSYITHFFIKEFYCIVLDENNKIENEFDDVDEFFKLLTFNVEIISFNVLFDVYILLLYLIKNSDEKYTNNYINLLLEKKLSCLQYNTKHLNNGRYLNLKDTYERFFKSGKFIPNYHSAKDDCRCHYLLYLKFTKIQDFITLNMNSNRSLIYDISCMNSRLSNWEIDEYISQHKRLFKKF